MIERLLRIIGAYLVACFAAGLVVALELMLVGIIEPLLKGRPLSSAPWSRNADALLWLTWMASILAVVHAFLPAALVIAIAEVRRQRSAAFYCGAGVVAAVAALGIFLRWSLPGTHGWWWLEAIPIVVTAGLAGGLVYWWIAGRSAGAATASQAPSSPQT